MISNQKLINKIRKSPSFSDEEKEKIISMVPSLDNEKKKKLTWILLEEKQKLASFKKEYFSIIEKSFDNFRTNTKQALAKSKLSKHKQKAKLWNFFKGINQIERTLKGQ